MTLQFAADPSLEDPYAHQAAIEVDRAPTNDLAVNANGCARLRADRNRRLQPGARRALGTSRRPNDLPDGGFPGAPCVNGGIPPTSASSSSTRQPGDGVSGSTHV